MKMEKKIFKLYGLPRSGTNVLNWLLILNFPNYTSALAEHGVQYLGWKHGLPLSKELTNEIENITKEKILFVFTKRKYEDWTDAIKKRHQNTWEFPERFSGSDKFIINCPNGPELYGSSHEFYIKRQGAYNEFCELYPEYSIIIDFEDLQRNQSDVILKIKDKFNLDLICDKPIEIKKKINMSGHWEDFIN